MTLRSLAIGLVFALALLCVPTIETGCAKAPPQLSPTAQLDYNKTRVIKAIDVVRDAAIDGEAAGVFSTDDTRQIVLWHKSAVQIIEVAGTGWKETVQTTLDELVKHLKPGAQTKVAPYVALIKALLQEV